MSPDDRGEGAAGEAEEQREAGARERVEEALRRRAARGADASGSPRDGEPTAARPPSPEGAAGEHWSRTVRRRVAERDGASAAGAENGEGAGGRSLAAPAEGVRERVERRLREAEERRSRSAVAAGPAGAAGGPAPASPPRAAAGPGPEDLPFGPEGAPDWETPAAAPETAPASAGETLPPERPSRLAAFIATCAFLGRVPIAPGTAGAAAGLAAFLLTRNLPGVLPVALFVVAVAVGLWAGARHAKDLRQPDPRSVVVDEFCGMWLALVGTNPSVLVMVAAFVAFRFLDIVKPPPVRQAERLPGGIGIMADDLVAGGIVRLVLLLALGM